LPGINLERRKDQGCCPWSLVVLKDKTRVLGPGLEGPGLGPGLDAWVLVKIPEKDLVQVLQYKQGMMQTKWRYYRTRQVCYCVPYFVALNCKNRLQTIIREKKGIAAQLGEADLLVDQTHQQHRWIIVLCKYSKFLT